MMLVTYDSSADAVYIYLQTDPVVARSVTLDGDRIVDFDDSDHVVGIEILAASGGFEIEDIIERFGLADRREELIAAAQEFRPAAAV